MTSLLDALTAPQTTRLFVVVTAFGEAWGADIDLAIALAEGAATTPYGVEIYNLHPVDGMPQYAGKPGALAWSDGRDTITGPSWL